MIKLERPTNTAEATYTTCISRVRDRALKAKLEAATDQIVTESDNYIAAVEAETIHLFPRTAPFAGLSAAELGKVYTQRMAAKMGPGREIYDTILSIAPHGRCPLCVQRVVSTLDHHLPKAHYPALSVTPLNLIPACSDCNKAKIDTFPTSPEEVGLHPYYDEIDEEIWLEAVVLETRPASLLYRVSEVENWTAALQQRVVNHFNSLHLAKLYHSEQAEELLNIRFELSELLARAGAEQVRRHLVERAASCAAVRPNGWRTAAYRAWSESAWFYRGGFADPG